jgi:RNA polymerase sigma-70 factor (ECF subfamily)
VSNNESIWLDRALQGDSEAFAFLVETYQKPVYNLCYRMLGNPGDAEDAAQETFLRAYKSLRRYDRSRPFPTWLLSIAAHYCIDQIRRERMTLVSMDEMPDLEIPDRSPGPETAVSRGEEQQKVRALLASLNPVDRAAVIMYYWYDFSYVEIAQTLSLTESAVKSRLHRARHELADQWTHQHPQTLAVERNPHGKVRTPAL